MAEISGIPGVDPGDVAALAALSLHTTDDLLRTERTALVRRVPGLALETVLHWQAIAALVQVDGLKTADAAALVDAGAGGVDELATWVPSRILAVLPGLDADSAARWAIDAMRISQTGAVNGNVRLRGGEPVEGATVRVGGQSLSTDARGRFRCIRLALDRNLTIEVHHAELGFRRVRNVAVHRAGALVSTDVVLVGRRQSPTVLSELRGDALPPLVSAPMTTKQITDTPESNDVLVVVRAYGNGDYQAASRFLDFVDGRFVRRTYRIAKGAVPVIPQRGDDLVADGAGWRVTKLSAAAIERRRARFAWQKRFPTVPETAEGQKRMAEAIARSIGARR